MTAFESAVLQKDGIDYGPIPPRYHSLYFLHIFSSEPNVFFSNTRARGKLRPIKIDLEAMAGEGDEMPVLGAGTLEELTWKENLDLYACTECGRCQNSCPAWSTGRP